MANPPYRNDGVPGAYQYFPVNKPDIGAALSLTVWNGSICYIVVSITRISTEGHTAFVHADNHQECGIQEQDLCCEYTCLQSAMQHIEIHPA